MTNDTIETKPLTREHLDRLRTFLVKMIKSDTTIFHEAHAEELVCMCDMAISSLRPRDKYEEIGYLDVGQHLSAHLWPHISMEPGEHSIYVRLLPQVD